MKKVLILGNGLSRQESYEARNFIDAWDGEIWVCNRAYKEYHDLPRINLVIGDDAAVIEAYKYKEMHGLSYEVYAKHHIKYYTPDKIKLLHLPKEYINDSGTSLVYKALFENYEEIKLVGFDLGGKDIYVKNHDRKDKSIWVRRWRKINEYFTLNKIDFIGNPEIKNFILSNVDPKKHVATYLPSLKNQQKPNIKKGAKTVLILGNGASRLRYQEFINNWTSEIWGCNWFFKEAKLYPNLTRMGSVHKDVILEMYQYRFVNNFDYTIYTKPIFKDGLQEYPDISFFGDTRGFSTGSLMVLQALLENYKRIYLCGFDFGGKDVYQKHDVVGVNFINQFKDIIQKYGMRKLKFIGKRPKFILDIQKRT